MVDGDDEPENGLIPGSKAEWILEAGQILRRTLPCAGTVHYACPETRVSSR
jgi:hypothetical protein